MRLVSSKNRAIQYVGAIWSSLNKEDCNFIKQGQTQLSSTTHCLQSSLRKWYAWKPSISFIKGKAQKWFTRSACTRCVIVLGVARWCGEPRRNPKQHQLTTEYQVYQSQRWNCRMHGDKITSQSWSRCSRNIGMRNNALETWIKSRRSTARNHKNYSKIWTKQRCSNFARILQNFNGLIAIVSRKDWNSFPGKWGSFIAVAVEIWSTSGVLRQPRRLISTFLQSLVLSLRRIPLEEQSSANLNDRSCSTRRSRCFRKQDKVNMATIRESFQGGTNKNDTESHWRSTI